MLRETGELVFATSEGGTRVVRIPDPMAIITQDILDMAEVGIITANPFEAGIGNLLNLKRADRVIVNNLVLIAPAAA